MDDVTQPFAQQYLQVDVKHTLYLEQSGNPTGTPVVFLHGGPGSGCQPGHRHLFDLQHFHVIAVDQRGAGKSTPHSSLVNNTTWDLVADLEKIRQYLDIEKWMIVGGSWGATLAFAYAQRHPSFVSAIVVRSLFLGTQAELKRAFIEIPSIFYPELYGKFQSYIPKNEQHDLLAAYYRRLLHPDKEISLPTMHIWHDYERALSQLVSTSPFLETIQQIKDSTFNYTLHSKPNTPCIEAHYFSQDCFLKPNQLLDDMRIISHIPGGIVQSRFDLLCPPQTSFELMQHWKEAEILFVEAAGHTQNEMGVFEALRSLIKKTADKIESTSNIYYAT